MPPSFPKSGAGLRPAMPALYFGCQIGGDKRKLARKPTWQAGRPLHAKLCYIPITKGDRAISFRSAPSCCRQRKRSAILNGMRVPIDKGGRIILPKAVRERWHLEPGVYLELEERHDGLILRHAEQRASMTQKNGIW